MKTVGTLKELNVKPGDVVAWHKAGKGYEWYDDEFFGVCDLVVNNARGVYSKSVDDGFGAGCIHEFAIISRATDAPNQEDANPKLWRDMTPEEKGALLLHQHELGVLQRWYEGEWLTLGRWDAIYDHCAYRIKPEPKVEVERVTIVNADGITIGNGTVTTRNGKPDPASIKMEEL